MGCSPRPFEVGIVRDEHNGDWPVYGLKHMRDPRDPAEQEANRLLFQSSQDLRDSCEELLRCVEAERGWEGEPDAEPMVMRARDALAASAGQRLPVGTMLRCCPPTGCGYLNNPGTHNCVQCGLFLDLPTGFRLPDAPGDKP